LPFFPGLWGCGASHDFIEYCIPVQPRILTTTGPARRGALKSIFFEFNLPNATTWFYFSLLLAIALFFKFSRLLSLRNWDVLALFLLVPGLLLRQEASEKPAAPEADATAQAPPTEGKPTTNGSNRLLWFAYLWLLCGSAYFLARCFMDLALVRRPALGPNLNFGGLAWLAAALFICLAVVAIRRPVEASETSSKGNVLLDSVQEGVARAVDPAELNSDTAVWVKRTLAFLCQLAIVTGLVVIGWRHFQDITAGMAAATFYLLLPYSAMSPRAGGPPVFQELLQVWPIALLLWAIVAYRKPSVAGSLTGIAAGTIFFPALTLPIWLSFYRRRGAGRFAAFFLIGLALGLAATGLILLQNGQLADGLRNALERAGWQPWKTTANGFWEGVHWAYRLPVFIAYAALVLITGFWPSPKNLGHVLALLAAVLIGIQFWFADEGGTYILWYLPFMLLLTFRPNLADRVAPAIQTETDWLHRLGRRALRSIKKRLGIPEPVAPVQ
jgi:hypothetical protein